MSQLRKEIKRMSISEDKEVNDITGQVLASLDKKKETDDSSSLIIDEGTDNLKEDEIKDIAEKALAEGELSNRETAGGRRSSMMVQTAKLGESATTKTLEHLEALAKASTLTTGKAEGGKETGKSPVKMAEIEAAQKRIKRMSVVGTRGFMAPEIVEGKALKRKYRRGYDETADWFALGVTTYVMLTGGQPFADEDPTNVSASLLQKEFPRDPSGKIKRPAGFASLMQTVKYPR